MQQEIAVARLADQFLERYGLDFENELPLAEIQSRWKAIAGPLAVHSYPARFQSGVLVIHTEHTAYMQELQLLQSEFIDRIQKQLGLHVKKIQLKRKRIERQDPRQKKPKTAYLSDEELETLKSILEKI